MKLSPAVQAALQRGFESFCITFLAALVVALGVLQGSLFTATGQLNLPAAAVVAGTSLLAGTIKAVRQFFEVVEDSIPSVVAAPVAAPAPVAVPVPLPAPTPTVP